MNFEKEKEILGTTSIRKKHVIQNECKKNMIATDFLIDEMKNRTKW